MSPLLWAVPELGLLCAASARCATEEGTPCSKGLQGASPGDLRYVPQMLQLLLSIPVTLTQCYVCPSDPACPVDHAHLCRLHPSSEVEKSSSGGKREKRSGIQDQMMRIS